MAEIKVKYIIDNDKMTDGDYEAQEEKEFIITEQMIYDLVYQNDTKIAHLEDTIEIMEISLT
jgi:hypothetical protein